MRTVRDFVRDLCCRGKTDLQVRGVARETRWRDKMDEVKSWLSRRGDRWRNQLRKDS